MSTAKYTRVANSFANRLRANMSSLAWWHLMLLVLVAVFFTCLTCIKLPESTTYNPLPSKDNTSFNSTSLPVVMWHGMGDSCCASWSIGALQEQLQEALPGKLVAMFLGKHTT